MGKSSSKIRNKSVTKSTANVYLQIFVWTLPFPIEVNGGKSAADSPHMNVPLWNYYDEHLPNVMMLLYPCFPSISCRHRHQNIGAVYGILYSVNEELTVCVDIVAGPDLTEYRLS